MGRTITEKILASHAGKSQVEPGELITAKLDGVLANDITGPIAIAGLKNMGYSKVFNDERVYLVMDHFTPNANLKAAQQCKISRDFARKCGLKHFYDVGSMGVEHALLPDQGLVLPGEIIIGGDSHTCTYGALGAFSTGVGSTDVAVGMALGELWFKVPEGIKFIYRGKLPPYITGKDLILYTIGQIGVDGALYKTMEFTGEVIDNLSMDGRLTMCNMAVEAGAKNGIINPDEKTEAYVRVHNKNRRPFKLFRSDPDARYSKVYEWDVSQLEPQVAFPHLPDNVKNVGEADNITIDQVVIGSCTNGRMEDLRIAADLLRGKKVHPNVRTIVIPATQDIYLQAIKEGLINIFIESGAAVSTPTCGPCFGGHMGTLAEGERAVSTSNRNFVGRMGHVTSEVYLASPAVAAASAVKGKIANPLEVL